MTFNLFFRYYFIYEKVNIWWINMANTKNTLKNNNIVKGFATGIVVVFILAIFIWTLDPNMRDQVWRYLKGGRNYVSVNGENILTAGQIKNIIESRNINFSNFPDSLIIQALKNFRDINREITNSVLIKYANDVGLEMSPEAKQSLAIELYKKSKVQFEKKYNIRFRMKLTDFYDIARENYLTSIVNTSLTQGILITKAEVNRKYMLENNKRQIVFASYDFEDYFKNQNINQKELEKFFKSSEASSFRSNVRNKITATAISGDDEKKMNKLLNQVRQSPGLFEQKAKEQKETQKDFVITNKNKELNPLKQVGVGKYSKLIKRTVRGKVEYFIFKIVKKHDRKFNELNRIELKNLEQNYKKSNAARNKYLSAFQTKVKALFKDLKIAVKKGADFATEARRRGLDVDTTEYFPVALKDSIDKSIHDPVQNQNKKPIKIFGSSNIDFLKTVFSLKKGEVSEMQNSGFTYYMAKLTGVITAGKMDAMNYKRYIAAMKKRQQEEYHNKIMQELYKKYEVVWHEKNIIQLIRALQGRSS